MATHEICQDYATHYSQNSGHFSFALSGALYPRGNSRNCFANIPDIEFYCKQIECPPGYWKCADGIQCTPEFTVCNGKTYETAYNVLPLSCHDKSDENLIMCGCKSYEWMCQDKQSCVVVEHVCDGKSHCRDKSDEYEAHCLTWNCTMGAQKCKNNQQCVLVTNLCDGRADCIDGSDEKDCESYTCLDGRRKCGNNLKCILENEICDGKLHCEDGSDELCNAACLVSTSHGKAIIKKCVEDINMCVPADKYCNGIADCPAGSDEADCSCEDWNMLTCGIGNTSFCCLQEWITLPVVSNPLLKTWQKCISSFYVVENCFETSSINCSTAKGKLVIYYYNVLRI